MTNERAAFYVDGFNLYHAIDDLKKPHLKWLSLWDLAKLIIPQHSEDVVGVFYFSAFATHHPERLIRHRAYVAALESTGVSCVMGRFKENAMRCRSCKSRWTRYEEKETDVNIAVRIVHDAHRNLFDVCYLVSQDTDLTPAIRILREDFPEKRFVSVGTPHRPHSSEILKFTSAKQKLKPSHLERCLLPERVTVAGGRVIERPPSYTPPTGTART